MRSRGQCAPDTFPIGNYGMTRQMLVCDDLSYQSLRVFVVTDRQARFPRWNSFWVRVGTTIATVTATAFRSLSGVRGLTGILFVGAFLGTVFAAWHYPDSVFGAFSQSLGITIASVFVGLWGADFYYRKDAYKKRYRDVEVSVYTTWLLMVGVETIRQHIANAKTGMNGLKSSNDVELAHKITAHSEMEAGHTAAELTIKMAYLALTNLSSFSPEAVKAGKDKFTTDEREATVRQQVVQGRGSQGAGTNAPNPQTGSKFENAGDNNG